jgi:hypothetical protein
MTEDKTTPDQSYIYNTDQQVSVNAFIDIDIEGENVRFQVTSRYGAKSEKIVTTTAQAIAAYKELRGMYPRPVAIVPEQVEKRVPIDDSGNPLPEIKVATAGKLAYEDKNGTIYWKVMDCTFAAGERGTKFGITVWPETWQAAGLNLEAGQPVPDISGWRIDYVCNEKGYPSKVTRMLPPKASAEPGFDHQEDQH